jgi:hypothetical protein
MSGSWYDVLLCPECREETQEAYKDDTETQFYKCRNGHITSKPLKERGNALSPREEREYYRDDQEETEDSKTVYVPKPTIVTPDFLAEEIWDRKTEPKYLKYTFQTQAFEETAEISLGETTQKGQPVVYIPVSGASLKKGVVTVPSGITETTFEDLFAEIDAFSLNAYDACGQDKTVQLLTRVAVGSWFLDRFVANPEYDIAGAGKFAPILPIRGPSCSGKNRLAFILRLLSYRPYFEMSTYRIPSLYRPLDVWQGTLILDEADFANTNEKSELIHFLNCRATGTPLTRQNPKDPSVTDTFSNFGITICTQRKPFDDNATESRAVPFYSEKSDKEIPVLETDEMMQAGFELQNKLLYLRMKYYQSVKIDKSQWIGDLLDPRLIATLLPLLALSEHEPKIHDIITENAKAVQRAKIKEKAESMDGTLINYLWEKINECLFVEHQPGIFYFLESAEINGEDAEEELETKILTTQMLAERFKWSSRAIRTALNSLNLARKDLPSCVKVGKKTHRVIFFEGNKMEKRLREFVADYTPNEINGKKTVTQVTEVTLSTCGGRPEAAKLGEPQKTRPPHLETVTSVTSVTNPELTAFSEAST